MVRSKWRDKRFSPWKGITKWIVMAVAVLMILFIGIGVLTGAKTTYRLYSETIQNWTSKLEGGSFIYLFEMENRLFAEALPEGERLPTFSSLGFQLFTSLKPNDPRSLLGREIPGLSSYHSQIVIAGEGLDYTTLPIESEPPTHIEDRGEVEVTEEKPKEEEEPVTKEDQVYIYHTHNYESFYPHLPDQSTSYDKKVNITLVGEKLGDALEKHGIGAMVDKTDVNAILKDKGWEHYQSYDAVRPVVEEAMSQHESLKFFFDLHRDSIAREHTTTTIDGKDYARFAFVIGAENEDYEKNLKFASNMHELLEKHYPGISRGVITKKGAGVDGVYNQDLSSKSIVIEFGGVYNHLDEMYRSAEVFAEVFADYYYDAEKVSGE